MTPDERFERFERRFSAFEDRVEDALADAVASWRALALKQIGAVAVAALGVIGTVLATRIPPAPPPRSAMDLSLDECRPLAGAERRACFERKAPAAR